jgi:hypothetical protein
LVAWLGVGVGVWRLPLIALVTGLIALPFVSLLQRWSDRRTNERRPS